MLTGSIPKLLQEAHAVKQALEEIGEGLPAGISASEMSDRITALEDIIRQLDTLNADITRLIDSKGDVAERVSDYIVQSRSAIKGIFGSVSFEYDMVGGTWKSERKKPKKK